MGSAQPARTSSLCPAAGPHGVKDPSVAFTPSPPTYADAQAKVSSTTTDGLKGARSVTGPGSARLATPATKDEPSRASAQPKRYARS